MFVCWLFTEYGPTLRLTRCDLSFIQPVSRTVRCALQTYLPLDVRRIHVYLTAGCAIMLLLSSDLSESLQQSMVPLDVRVLMQQSSLKGALF